MDTATMISRNRSSPRVPNYRRQGRTGRYVTDDLFAQMRPCFARETSYRAVGGDPLGPQRAHTWPDTC